MVKVEGRPLRRPEDSTGINGFWCQKIEKIWTAVG
jgi:hypothetical protein